MASVAQISDLNSNEIEWLANHLGHNVHMFTILKICCFFQYSKATVEESSIGYFPCSTEERSAEKAATSTKLVAQNFLHFNL